MYLVISTSLNPESRSRVVAQHAAEVMSQLPVDYQFIDLIDYSLPLCDATSCYSHPEVASIGKQIAAARGILLATPIYNFDVCASAKNLIELTGQSWMSRVVGFACAAGGQTSYMSVMALANSLMLDFRTFIVPRFVYVTGDHFLEDRLVDPEILDRVAGLVREVVRVGAALSDDRNGQVH